MTTDRFWGTWKSLEDQEYRREFAGDVGTGLAFQIRMLREKHGWTQEELASRTGKQQETISHWEDPNYGSYTLNSLKSLAGAFDVALVVKFAPFSELVNWGIELTPEKLAPKSYTEEHQALIEASLADLSFTLEGVWLTDNAHVVTNPFENPSGFATTATLQVEKLSTEEQALQRQTPDKKVYARAA